LTRRRRDCCGEHADGGRLSGAIRSEQAEASPGGTSKVMPFTASIPAG
jgi:hypothetical protein